MKIQKVKNFGLSQFYPNAHDKKYICLHHTCGSTAEGAIAWWLKTPEKVGTAFIIDKDGTVHQCFDSAHWAYQYGLKSANRNDLEKASIGIELVNEGGLYNRAGKYFTDWNKEFKGNVTTSASWRGYKSWADYTDAQYAALAELLKFLADKHDLELKLNDNTDFNLKVFESHTVINHSNVRQDKTDLSPAFDFDKLKEQLSHF